LKDIGLKFRFYLLHQVGVVAGLLLLAWMATAIVAALGLGRLSGFVLAGLAYSVLAGIAVSQIPIIVGATHADMANLAKKLLALVGRI
jgi:hypothetical protein